MSEYSIFIFQRSLRLYDNIGLYNTIIKYNNIICIFILTPEQITNQNKYKSDNSIKFMIEALIDLNNELFKYNSKLYIFYNDIKKVLIDLNQNINIKSINCIKDYTLYSKNREELIKSFCDNNNIIYNIYEDILLFPVNTIKSASNNIYYKFTPFYKKALTYEFPKVLNYKIKNIVLTNKIKNNIDINNIYNIIHLDISNNIYIIGKRKYATDILNNINNFSNYNNTRDLLNLSNTTKLSAYLKFGLISIREVYNSIKKLNNDLIKQILWREFYYNISYNNLKIYNGNSIKSNYDNIKWNNNIDFLNAWKNGITGFPIVDAGMRELNETGYMHNRARLITSNFLIKLLYIDWKIGEQYFSSKLLDYDPAINNGNWQWSSGSGVDSQPYFRIFNPWLQSKKFDKDCIYIKKWIPELSNVPNEDIHIWNITYKKYNTYYKPIIDYKKQKEYILNKLKKYINK